MKVHTIIIILLIFSKAIFSQPSGYYNTAKGKSGSTLKTALYYKILGHTRRSYSQLWTDFQTTDRKSNGYVWDMYSDVPGGITSYDFSYTGDQCGTYGGEGDCYNREHSFPKSWWGGGTSSTDTMYTDLFHLVPTDGYVNYKRSAYPYGEVGSASWTSTNGTKLGSCNYPGYSGTVFEPIDDYKGDFARNYFYMATRYQNKFDSWASNTDMLDGSGFSSWALNLLLDWHQQDPVSQKEIDRNNDIYGIQNNRNPFIDHPEFVQRVWGGDDDYAPIFYDTYPSSDNIAATSFDLTANLDEECTVYFVVLSNGASAPSNLQIKAGKDASGTVVATNLRGSINIVSANNVYSKNISSLATTTDYDVYIIAEDNASPSNLQSTPEKIDITTGSSGGGGSNTTYSESFDIAGNWSSGSGYTAYTYTIAAPAHQDYFSTNNGMREGSYTNSAPYSWRLKNTSSAYLRYECEGTVSSFSIWAARWDNSPIPQVTVRYSTNSGITYTTAFTFSGNDFSGDKVFKQFSHSFSTAISNSAGQKIYIEFVTNSGERVMYDDFEITFSSGGGGANDSESNIVKKASWNEPTNIDYKSYSVSNNLTTSNSIEVAKFTINDGGNDNTDSDTETTKLTDLELNIANWENIEALAIFDGSSRKSETNAINSSTITFSGISGGIEASDEGSKDFSIYATFKTNVDDNENLKFTISSATAESAGSTFTAGDAGGATTDNTGNNNKLIVTSTKLSFSANKPPSSVTNATNFEVEIKATDVNGNIDIDASYSISLVKASGSGTLSSASGLTQSLSSGTFLWNDIQYNTDEDFAIEAQTASLTDVTSGTISCTSVAPIPDLIISEVADPKDNYKVRFIELYNGSGSSIDFSTETFYLCRQSNGGAWADIQLTGTLNAKALYVIANNVSDFNAQYGFNPEKASSNISGNGNDGYFLYYDGPHTTGTLIDAFGVINEDGAGKAWEYTDSRVVRETSAQKTSGSKAAHTFNIADWTITNNANAADMTPGNKETSQTLPIKLLSFTATNVDNNSIYIKWQTASETNNDYFTIERSYNNENFIEIAQITGAGNSNKILNYGFKVLNIDLSQTIYYRLKQTDFDGKYSYSETIWVNSKSNDFKILKVYGNDGIIYLNINSNSNSNYSLKVTDISGRIIMSSNISLLNGYNSFRFRIDTYSTGLYFIRIINADLSQIINAKLIMK